MQYIFVGKEKYGRLVYLTKERYQHIMLHPEMQNKLEYIEQTLKDPVLIEESCTDEKVKYYYRYDYYN